LSKNPRNPVIRKPEEKETNREEWFNVNIGEKESDEEDIINIDLLVEEEEDDEEEEEESRTEEE
jgi:hypothetical protein